MRERVLASLRDFFSGMFGLLLTMGFFALLCITVFWFSSLDSVLFPDKYSKFAEMNEQSEQANRDAIATAWKQAALSHTVGFSAFKISERFPPDEFPTRLYVVTADFGNGEQGNYLVESPTKDGAVWTAKPIAGEVKKQVDKMRKEQRDADGESDTDHPEAVRDY